jgi:photolyase PhrII
MIIRHEQPIQELLKLLPDRLRERARLLNNQPLQSQSQSQPQFVLYWTHAALRVEENPALQVATELANRLQLPLLVYQGLSASYRYASDRHHTFILQGASELQAEFRQRGITYLLNVEQRHQTTAKPLQQLAERAAVTITDDMPVLPASGWMRVLARRIATPIVAVDTACVVPMQLVGRAYDRAFAYRDATKELLARRLTLPPFETETVIGGLEPSDFNIETCGFEPVDLRQHSIAELVARCEIDHAVGPIPHSRGGSQAGYQRWDAFKENGLRSYARLRNNPLVDGVSRLSPYLHYGMIAPMRIAREAALLDHAGAEKFLDELLIWRELAYTFCFYRPEHSRTRVLPEWARATLDKHAGDRRESLHSWETLARGQTGDSLWDAAQRSLLIHGELHNNVRMTWGKALLGWTTDARQALERLIDLNHRYALDGRDPASYGGILWCLGQFDRPFSPERPILGTVRDRSTSEHARRLDTAAYARKTARPACQPVPTVAVVGAGISGLMCARTLADHGLPVTVFEKSRGAGGRMATRRGDNGLQFDHGAQYFTCRDARFQRYLDSWIEDGLVARWDGRIVGLTHGEVTKVSDETTRYVGVPRMNAVCRHLAKGVNVQLNTRIAPLQRSVDGWTLSTTEGLELGSFDTVIVSAPADQTQQLLNAAPELATRVAASSLRPCWSVMLALKSPLELDFAGAFVADSALSWIARDSSKPGRPTGPEAWLLHASAAWSQEHLDSSPEAVAPHLVEAFVQATGGPAIEVHSCSAHLWRFAIPAETLTEACLFDPALQLGTCGDWCAGPRVEGAFLSGMAAAGRVLGTLGHRPTSPAPSQGWLFSDE